MMLPDFSRDADARHLLDMRGAAMIRIFHALFAALLFDTRGARLMLPRAVLARACHAQRKSARLFQFAISHMPFHAAFAFATFLLLSPVCRHARCSRLWLVSPRFLRFILFSRHFIFISFFFFLPPPRHICRHASPTYERRLFDARHAAAAAA